MISYTNIIMQRLVKVKQAQGVRMLMQRCFATAEKSPAAD